MQKTKHLVKSLVFAGIVILIAVVFVYAIRRNTEIRSRAGEITNTAKACELRCMQRRLSKTLFDACMATCKRLVPTPTAKISVTPTPKISKAPIQYLPSGTITPLPTRTITPTPAEKKVPIATPTPVDFRAFGEVGQ